MNARPDAEMTEVQYTQRWLDVLAGAAHGDHAAVYGLVERAIRAFPHLPWETAMLLVPYDSPVSAFDYQFRRDLLDLVAEVLGAAGGQGAA